MQQLIILLAKYEDTRKHEDQPTESRLFSIYTSGTTLNAMISISETDLASYFAKPYMYEQTPIGFAMGLANSEFGGIAWYLKTTLIEEGEAIGCGNLVGPVAMDTYESADIGYILAQEILCRKQPKNNFFVNSRICIHMPNAHGPSAGCTVTTSLLSLAMKKPVRKDLAMTGQVTITGKILPIGDVEEKTMGARLSRVKTIIFPEANRKEFDEMDENVKQGFDIHFVNDYEQVFELAFNDDH